MTDRRARRSSIYLDKEQAALDLKEARALKLPDRRRRLQPEHGVVGRGPRPGGGFASEARVRILNKSTQLRTHDRPRRRDGGKERPRHTTAGAEVRRWIERAEGIRVARHRTPA
jgi:hypothetical protein